jgi:methionyl-tRNA formyltransferase
MGTPEFAATVLKKLVEDDYDVIACVSQPDKPVGRHMKLESPPVKLMAESLEIPVFQPVSVRTPEFLTWINSLHPDMIVTAAYGKILPQVVLDVPVFGCLNVHASLLPKHRGAAPIQWSILSGDSETGITVMKMDAGMDTGDILSFARINIDPNITTIELTGKLANLGAQLLLETIPGYISGDIVPQMQDDELASFSPPIRKEQGLIDWNESAVQIHNKIRALSAWPGAYTYLSNNRIKIYSSVVDGDGCKKRENYCTSFGKAVPGMIIYATKTELSVACGDGCISLLCIQPESSKRVNVCDCAHNFQTGLVFGGGWR